MLLFEGQLESALPDGLFGQRDLGHKWDSVGRSWDLIHFEEKLIFYIIIPFQDHRVFLDNYSAHKYLCQICRDQHTGSATSHDEQWRIYANPDLRLRLGGLLLCRLWLPVGLQLPTECGPSETHPRWALPPEFSRLLEMHCASIYKVEIKF